MTEISAVMRAYRDALDRHRIPWADDTYDTERVGGYRLRVERTETILDEHRVSVIWGYQCLPEREPTGVTIGYPNYLEVQYDPVSTEPLALIMVAEEKEIEKEWSAR